MRERKHDICDMNNDEVAEMEGRVSSWRSALREKHGDDTSFVIIGRMKHSWAEVSEYLSGNRGLNTRGVFDSINQLFDERDEWQRKAEAFAAVVETSSPPPGRITSIANEVLAARIRRDCAEAWDEGAHWVSADSNHESHNPYRND